MTKPAANANAAANPAATLVSLDTYVLDANLPGRSKADGYMPSHTTCVQVSSNRFLVVFGVRGFCGIDDERDVVYQLRADAPDGPILKNAFLAQNVEQWDPFNTGQCCLKILGTPTVFGVPKGALIQGRVHAHHNVFVIKWYTYGKVVQDKRVLIDEELTSRTMHIEWLQCRLNDAEDDIEIISPTSAMHQKGYEDAGLGEQFCEQADLKFMNHAMVPSVALTKSADQWVEVDHFNGGTLAAVRYAFNEKAGLYEWVQTGPLLEGIHTEACICQVKDAGTGDSHERGERGRWLISARTFKGGGRTAWWCADDPFSPWEEAHLSEPATYGPRTLFTCADGVARVFSGSIPQSPYGEKRNPLFCWDVNPNDFSLSNRQVVFDFYQRGFYQQGDERLKDSQGPMAGFVKLCPHQGNRQLLTHRVTKAGGNADYVGDSETDERSRFGSYRSAFIYARTPEPAWVF